MEIISRDRAEVYAEGATKGAPDASQVADRWHVLKNLSETLERLLLPHQRRVNQALAPAHERPQQHPATRPSSPDEPAVSSCVTASVAPVPLNRHAHLRQARRANRAARYHQVCALHRQGLAISAIARTVGLDRNTIRRYRHAPSVPEHQTRRPTASILDPYKAYLNARLGDAGDLSSAHRLREIRTQGYRGGHSVLFAYLASRRPVLGLLSRTKRHASPTPGPVSIRHLVGLLLRPPQALTPQNHARVQTLGQAHPTLHEAVTLAHAFTRMIRDRQADVLEHWLTQAAQSADATWRGFATSLRRDIAAVRAAVALPWSNGPVEGHINRLKMLKRQMYGRAHFDLLRKRVLYAP